MVNVESAYLSFEKGINIKDYALCAQSIYDYINSSTKKKMDLPVDQIPNLEKLVKALVHQGLNYPTNPELFHQFCVAIHKKLVDGRGNPSQNN